MKLGLYPTTKLAIDAAGCSIAFLIFMWIGIVYTSPKITFIIYSLDAIGFLMGIAALIKYKERTIFGFLPVVVGLVTLAQGISYFFR